MADASTGCLHTIDIDTHTRQLCTLDMAGTPMLARVHFTKLMHPQGSGSGVDGMWEDSYAEDIEVGVGMKALGR